MDPLDLAAHAGFLRRLAGSLLADDGLADDAVQETYAAALRGPPGENLRGWLAGVTRNISFRMLRREKGRRRAELLAARPESLPSAHALAESAEAQHRVAEAVRELDEPYRSVVLLRFYHQLSPTEIARKTGEPVATVKTRLRRAVARLRERLDEAHGGDRRAWSLALLPLVTRRAAAKTILGGIALMKTKVLAVAVVLALLATFFFARSRDRVASAEPRSRTTASLPAPEDDPVSASRPPAPAVERETPLAEAASGGERERYLEWRRVASLLGSSRRNLEEASALLKELGVVEEEAPPLADPATADLLRDLARSYRSAAPGAGRLDLLRRFAEAHARYLDATHDRSFLPFLEEVIGSSDVEGERELAVPLAGELTLDLLLRVAGSMDPAVRAAAVRSLAGSKDPRALEAVVRALRDTASPVRWTAAIELEYTIADPAHAAALLERLPFETHPLAADGMVRAVLALDPEKGARRVESAVADAPAASREAVLGALRSPVPPDTETAPAAPAKEEPAPDPTTRAYLERLLGEYRALEGKERLAALEKIARAHADYIERSGDASLLPALAEIARGSPAVDERVAVVRSFDAARDRRVVDLIVELKGSPEAAVRNAVAAALAWVRGEEAPRARRELPDLLKDPAPSVRIATALLLAVPVADRENVPRLLAALREETDVAAAYAMVDAVLRLDPGARIDSASRPAVEEALRMRAERK